MKIHSWTTIYSFFFNFRFWKLNFNIIFQIYSLAFRAVCKHRMFVSVIRFGYSRTGNAVIEEQLVDVPISVSPSTSSYWCLNIAQRFASQLSTWEISSAKRYTLSSYIGSRLNKTLRKNKCLAKRACLRMSIFPLFFK